MSEISRQENQGRRVMSRQEMQQSGEVQQQTIRRSRKVMTNLGSDVAERAFGSDSLFNRKNSDLSIGNGQHTDVEIKLDKSGVLSKTESMECKCAFREEEKRMLRELNDKHLKIISEKQSDISCLQQKLETLEDFRSSCVEEVRRELEETIRILERKIFELENERDDLRRIVSKKDYHIHDLERQKNDLELELKVKEEKLLIIEELNEQICNLKVNNDAAEEKIKWLQEQREREKASFEATIQKEFNEKWQSIITKIENGLIGGANFDELMRKIEEFRASLDNSAEFRNFEAKFKEKLKYLEENLEKERDIVKSFAGEKSALACKLKDLENELENMKRENGDMRQRLSDEKCVQAKTISEMEEEIRQLKTRLTEIQYSEWCINGGPVNFAAEIQMYENLLDTRKSMKEHLGRKDSTLSSSSDGSHFDATHGKSARGFSVSTLGRGLAGTKDISDMEALARGITVSSMGQLASRRTSEMSTSRSSHKEVRKSQTKIG